MIRLIILLSFVVISCAQPHYTYYFDRVAQSPKRASHQVSDETTTGYRMLHAPSIKTVDTLTDEKICRPDPDSEFTTNRKSASIRKLKQEAKKLLRSHDNQTLVASAAVGSFPQVSTKVPPQIKQKAEFKLTGRFVVAVLLIIAGAILMVLGGIIDILIGTVLMTIGAFMSTAKGGKKKSANAATGTGQMVDVVYLKNGSMIKGTIIEQVPDQSLKIKTADGNVFDYKMEDITKITKEKQP
jgi:hypothetical protein